MFAAVRPVVVLQALRRAASFQPAPRIEEKAGMEKSKQAQRRKPDTAKVDLKPPSRAFSEDRVFGAIRNPKSLRRSIGL
jgi:hypothetical protein